MGLIPCFDPDFELRQELAELRLATGNAGAAFTGPSLEVNTQGPSVTGITLGSALLDGSTPSTSITVNFSEKVTDFIGTDLVLPAGVTLSNGVLAANGLSFTATLTAGAAICGGPSSGV